jgi:hypothetical protein
VNDLQRVTVAESRRAISVARDNVAIALDNDASGSDLQLLEQSSDTHPVDDVFFFAVNFDFHVNKKTAFATATEVAREYGFKFVSSLIGAARL